MISFDGIQKSFGGRPVLEDVSLRISHGESLALVGPSGSGKSTLMKMLLGIISPDVGVISIRNQNIDKQDILTLRRSMGYLMQEGGLFPHWNIKRNISLQPVLLNWTQEEITHAVQQALRAAELNETDILTRMPSSLSGGQKQRVAFARAIASSPDILLLDEPFSALDPLTKRKLQSLIKSKQQQENTTVFFITHDLAEAFYMADRVAILNNGIIEQVGSAQELRASPASEFVKSFIETVTVT